jgi:hypothetical protein
MIAVRKQKKMIQYEMANANSKIFVTVGKYERDEVKTSIEKNIVKRIINIQKLPAEVKVHLFRSHGCFPYRTTMQKRIMLIKNKPLKERLCCLFQLIVALVVERYLTKLYLNSTRKYKELCSH